MSRFVRQIRFETEFDGDKVSMKLSPMTYGDMALVAPVSGQALDAKAFIAAVRDVLPKYVSEFGGLKDAEGVDLTLEDVVTQVYFVGLLQDVAVRLVRLSSPQVESVENPT